MPPHDLHGVEAGNIVAGALRLAASSSLKSLNDTLMLYPAIRRKLFAFNTFLRA
jgi:hypothetical protein